MESNEQTTELTRKVRTPLSTSYYDTLLFLARGCRRQCKPQSSYDAATWNVDESSA